MVTSSDSPNHWIVPGGGVEPDEDDYSAACRELLEEAGVKGTLIRCLGAFENTEKQTRTALFLMRITEELPVWDDHFRIGKSPKILRAWGGGGSM